MAISTTNAHVHRAVEFYNKASIYFGIANPFALSNPVTAPTLTATTPATATTIPAGTYEVAYTYLNLEGQETLASATATVTLTVGQEVSIAAIAVPTGVANVKFYMSAVSGGTTLYFTGVESAGGAATVISALPGNTAPVPPTVNGATGTWTDDKNPPAPQPSMSDLDNITGFRKVDTVNLVVPDPNGTIQYVDGNYSIVQQADAYTKGAKWVYIDTTILFSELPLGEYREVGIYSDLVVSGAVPSAQYAVTPDQVTSKGVLESVDFRQPSNRQSDQKEKLAMIIQF